MCDKDVGKIEQTDPDDLGTFLSKKSRWRIMVREVLYGLEALIACGAIAVVVLGAIQLVKLAPGVGRTEGIQDFFTVFEGLLSALLLLIVGVELAILLILHRPESLVEIMFFVIARKVLIKTEQVYELLLAVIAIGILFAVWKYLMPSGVSGTDQHPTSK